MENFQVFGYFLPLNPLTIQQSDGQYEKIFKLINDQGNGSNWGTFSGEIGEH